MEQPSYRYEAYLRCSPMQAWTAITDPTQTANYYYGTRVDSDWREGSPIRYFGRDGEVVADGRLLRVDPPRRVEMTFVVRWDPDLEAEGHTRMAWLVDPHEELTRVAIEYYDLDPSSGRASDFAEGVPYIVSGMKTLLETGEPLG